MVKPKKYLGQHFLKDKNIAEKIVNSLSCGDTDNILEIGPGTGVLTEFLLKKNKNLFVIEIDDESVKYLEQHFPELKGRIINKDFLKFNFSEFFETDTAVTGNFPYNISSQIVFKIIENRHKAERLVGMFQKEVAERICASPGSKIYGILSVLTQTYYETEYLFTVNENVFFPPPKVKSGVIRLVRKENFVADFNEKLFFKLVKTGFNQRRKTLKNSLKSVISDLEIDDDILKMRPEQLGFDDFIYLTKTISERISDGKK